MLTPNNIVTIGGARYIQEEIGPHLYTSPIIPPEHEIDGYGLPPQEQYFRKHKTSQRLQAITKEVTSKYKLKSTATIHDRLKFSEDLIQAVLANPEWYDYYNREADRRDNGYWFYNGYYDKVTSKWYSVPTYITGYHYMLCQWYKEGPLSFSYRENQRQVYYVWDLAIKDPDSKGVILAGPRRLGKTAIASCIAVTDLVTVRGIKIGMQSITEDFGATMFGKCVLGWKGLPWFFKPPYVGGDNPSSEISYNFNRSTDKDISNFFGYNDNSAGDHLSILDYRSSGSTAYDGEKLYRYLMDEWGKTEECDVNERWNVVLKTLEVDAKNWGKAFLMSTVEDVGNGSTMENAKKLWSNSKIQEIEDKFGNKHFKSPNQLKTVFMGYQYCFEIDKYGRPDVQAAVAKAEMDRALARAKGDNRRLAMTIRQTCMEENEMFINDSGQNNFNIEKLKNRLIEIDEMPTPPYAKYSLEWTTGEDGRVKVVAVPRPDIIDVNGMIKQDERARFMFSYMPTEDVLNAVRQTGEMKQNNMGQRVPVVKPLNDLRFACTTDPIKSDVAIDKRKASKACILAAPRFDMEGSNGQVLWQGHVPFVMYYGRPEGNRTSYWEDCRKLVYFLGCKILIEENMEAGMFRYFIDHGMEPFLSRRPAMSRAELAAMHNSRSVSRYKLGVSANAQTKTRYYPLMEQKIEETAHLMTFPDMIKQLIEFDIQQTQFSDIGVTYGMLCMELENMVYLNKKPPKLQDKSSEGGDREQPYRYRQRRKPL